MIDVDEALGRVLKAAGERGLLPAERVPLREAWGRILRETVRADQDMPPFTRSAMDGYALRAADVARAPVSLEVIEEIPAGRAPARAVGPGQASRIMTGAALPSGADAVQMVEKCRVVPPGGVEVLEPVTPGTHVRFAGEEMRKGAVLLEPGEVMTPAAVAVAATAGLALVTVSRRPRVAIVPTGDELVPVGSLPGPAQIRESNGHTLVALVSGAGGIPLLRDITRDTREDLAAAIRWALDDADVLLMSGGVSMGDYDLVGGALVEAGCVPMFDRVAIQPGKPLFFGVVGRAGGTLVFGLPGNPVSTLVDFLVFARPALRRIMGASRCLDRPIEAALEERVERRPGRRAYLPASLGTRDGRASVRLLPTTGSADMSSIARADALAILPEDAATLEAGVTVRALPLDGWTTKGSDAPGTATP